VSTARPRTVAEKAGNDLRDEDVPKRTWQHAKPKRLPDADSLPKKGRERRGRAVKAGSFLLLARSRCRTLEPFGQAG
jgi:hypothetical protein